MQTKTPTPSPRPARTGLLLLGLSALALLAAPRASAVGGGKAPEDWWDKEWTARKSVEIKPADGNRPEGSATVLVRLHEGNFPFAALKEDGSDLRVLADDHKTELAFHLERYDSLMNEGFLWIRLPEFAEGADPTKVWLYYGNVGASPAGDPAATYPDSAALVYHFAERGGPPRDYSAKGNSGSTAPTPTEGALIGAGIILFGTNGIDIPEGESLVWEAGAPLTLMAWVKPSAAVANGVLYRRAEGASSFVLGVDNGVPYVEVRDGASTARSTPGEAIGEGAWRHLAVVAAAGKIDLFVDGKPYGTVAAALPALSGPAFLGSTPEVGGGFAGEVDELQIHSAPFEPAMVRFLAASQAGTQEAMELVAMGDDEGGGGGGHNETLEHVMLFGDIAKNMMFDGWIAVGVCILMIVAGWYVAVQKFLYLNSIEKGSQAFLRQWKKLSSDLTALDHGDEESVKTMGGTVSKKMMRHVRRSPLYHLYQIGSDEIHNRISKNPQRGLGARSIQAIRASLDAGLVHENHRMNSKLVFLTISIAGGPYVGLLGTVVGVMITFALIAKGGEVDVNAIAPGIASALLATVAGLVVAIPALFIYSYLSSRIKESLASMQVFIDEFITRMAEFYPPPGESGPPVVAGQEVTGGHDLLRSPAHPLNSGAVPGESSPAHPEKQPKPAVTHAS
jgi:biopolymer transport protein ExbB